MLNALHQFIPDSLRSDADVFRRAQLLVAICCISIGVASFYALQYAFVLHLPAAACGLAFAVVPLVAAPLVLRSTASIRLAGNIVVAAYLVTQTILIYFEGGPISQARYWSVLMPLLATLFNGIQSGIRWTIITLILLLTFYFLKAVGVVFPAGLPPEQMKTQMFIGVSGLAVVIIILSRLFESGKNATLAMLNNTRRQSEERAQADYQRLEELRRTNERRAAEDMQRIKNHTEYLHRSIEELIVGVDMVSRGDLTVQMHVGNADDIERLSVGLTQSISNVRQMLVRVVEAVRATTQAVSAISVSTEQLASNAHEQFGQVSQVAGSVEEMSRTIADNTRQTSIAASEASAANTEAYRGGEVMRSMVDNVRQVGAVVLESSEIVLRLGRSSEQIGAIVSVIDEIAEQTNLLALNAAIEAARAGDTGRGFAVVADEVRKLAERTQDATRQISSTIATIQLEMNAAVQGMNQGRALVGEGSNLIERTQQALEQIIQRTSTVSDVVSQVAAASEEQAATSDEMARTMSAMAQMVEQSTNGLTAIARSIAALLEQTEELQRLVGRFTIGDLPAAHTQYQLQPAL
jgi:methyl-accepting chemotaxis protein